MSDHIRVDLDDGVLRIAFNRPDKKNAITNAMYLSLSQALQHAESDPQVRAVLFEAEGDAFTAGNDIADFAAAASGNLKPGDMQVHGFLAALARGQKPYVAAVQGLAVGIGTTMLMHCDLVYVAESARLSTPFVNLALVPEAASSWLIPARIGHARAFAMFALGEPIDGRTAATIGLANAALSVADVRPKALEAARKLARQPAGALQATKRLMRDAARISATIARENEIFGQRMMSAEAAEAFRAFAERRAPDFSKLSG